MKEVQPITLRIADTAPLHAKVRTNTNEEELAREAERNVNSLWSKWRHDFPDKTSHDVLAMAAYQFAKLYFKLQHTIDGQQKLLDDFEGELDRLLQLTTEDTDENK